MGFDNHRQDWNTVDYLLPYARSAAGLFVERL